MFNNQRSIQKRTFHSLMKRIPFTKYKNICTKIRNIGFPNGIYIFAYHFVFNENSMKEWERAYKGGTSIKNLKKHINFLLQNNFIPKKLSEIETLSEKDILQNKFFAVTFDDGYSNVFENTYTFFYKNKITPTLFVNAKFLRGEIYYRVLSSIIKNRKDIHILRDFFKKEFPRISWSENDELFMSQTKKYYTYEKTADVTQKCFIELYGPNEKVKCHYDIYQLNTIQKKGWEIGNHSYNHDTLSKISKKNVYETLNNNIRFLKKYNTEIIPWVAYPNGMYLDVNQNVWNYMNENSNLNGLFCGGGINFKTSKLDWMRIPLSDQNLDEFNNVLFMNSVKSKYLLNINNL